MGHLLTLLPYKKLIRLMALITYIYLRKYILLYYVLIFPIHFTKNVCKTVVIKMCSIMYLLGDCYVDPMKVGM
jgi:hypothetical protein